MASYKPTFETTAVQIPIEKGVLDGDLTVPEGSSGIVLFAHGSGSSRHSPRNRFVASQLQERGLATLLFDLLTSEEDEIDRRTRQLRFDIGLLTHRLTAASDWTTANEETARLCIGYFGASTGSAAALKAAAREASPARAVVSRGGRPDLAEEELSRVKVPVLLIVGERDTQVIEMNRSAMERMNCPTELQIVPRATHLFEEEGALEEVARLAGGWFVKHLDSTSE